MRVLIAEDDPVSRRVLEVSLMKWGHEVVVTSNGEEAWAALQSDPTLRLAVLDWMMPELDGVEVCKRARLRSDADYVYLILVTAKAQKEDLIAGLEAGADDFIAKPFDSAELRSRLRVGERIVNLKGALELKVSELEAALAHVKRLQGLLPICMHCRKIRTELATWQSLEEYVEDHSDATFSHGICEECMTRYHPE
jgi:DNA-binding response OmpR family regulator